MGFILATVECDWKAGGGVQPDIKFDWGVTKSYSPVIVDHALFNVV